MNIRLIVVMMFMLLGVENLVADNFNVHYKNGITQQEPTTTIDSISFGSYQGNVSSISSIQTTGKKQIRILFIGNSLTQDAVTYVPLLLKEMAPDWDYKLYIYYSAGKTLEQFYNDYFLPEKPCGVFSVCENATYWKNNVNNTTLNQILSQYEFDIICLQEYFNFKTAYPDSDLENFNKCVDYIIDNYHNPFEVVTFYHQPFRTKYESVTNLTKYGIDQILKKTAATSVIPAGYAVCKAMETELDSLGDNHHLSPDNVHAQEGLPCLLQAYVVAGWLLEKYGLPVKINNCTTRVTPENYKSINIPGKNLGTGVIVGDEKQNRMAQEIAIKTLKIGKAIDNGVYNSLY